MTLTPFSVRLLKGERGPLAKIVYTAVLLIPLVGPLLYLFLIEDVPPQEPFLRNNGPRGAYTDLVIAIQATLEGAAKKDAEEPAEAGQAQPSEDKEVVDQKPGLDEKKI